MTTWVARIPIAQRETLAPLRLEPDVEALTFGDDVFVRGNCESGVPGSVRALPGKIYTALADDQLIEHQKRTPTARLPVGHWSPLSQWLEVELPTAAFEAEQPTPVALEMVRTHLPRGEANLLHTDSSTWLRYAETAPAARLSQLRFTCRNPTTELDAAPTAPSTPDQVLVHGFPLPPIVGQRWVEQHGIAAPAGWTWTPEIDADVLNAAFALEPGDLILLFPDGKPHRVNRDHWSPAHRSAVRLNLGADSTQP